MQVIAPFLVEDLETIDASNADPRRRGLGHLANDRLQLSMALWEDQTGNLVQGIYNYEAWITLDDLTVVHVKIAVAINRLPS